MANRHRLAHTLRGLELDLAGHQGRTARFAADFLRRDPFCYRHYYSGSSVVRPISASSPYPRRLRCPCLYRHPDVRVELHPPFLGGALCFIRPGGGSTGDDSNLRNGVCPLALARRTVAVAEATRGLCCPRRRCLDLRAPA